MKAFRSTLSGAALLALPVEAQRFKYAPVVMVALVGVDQVGCRADQQADTDAGIEAAFAGSSM
jgi:hypothetical protein